ncbi:hypothetical protein DFH07DRAFT_767386 [Mycena maculata]|uniref:KOW domain-containing protein n=1 Tax=Mycena maculata TaxID=230809 RepID=A0AAD7JY30_9AGAR|nr:hypothetical protein DFH07DRAFT_767386 [Mycena maculata]
MSLDNGCALAKNARAPGYDDPPLFRVKIHANTPEVFIQKLMEKILSAPLHLHNPIVSVVHRPHDRRHVYVEATSHEELSRVLELRRASIEQLVSLADRPNVLRYTAPERLHTGWGRVVRKGRREQAVTVYAVPRLPDRVPAVTTRKYKNRRTLNRKLFKPEEWQDLAQQRNRTWFLNGCEFTQEGLLVEYTIKLHYFTQEDVDPTFDELELFEDCRADVLNAPWTHSPMSPALMEGDRVVGPNWRHGWITQITVKDGVRMARVKGDSESEPFICSVSKLDRHLLALPRTLKVNDRIEVVAGQLEFGRIGRVTEIMEAKGLVHCIDSYGVSDQFFTVRVNNVAIRFFAGDTVEVTEGPHRGRTGFVLEISPGLVDVYDPTQARYDARTMNWLAHDNYLTLVRGNPAEVNTLEEYGPSPFIDTGRSFSVSPASVDFAVSENEGADNVSLEWSALKEKMAVQRDGSAYDRLERERLTKLVMATGNPFNNREVFVDGGAHAVKAQPGFVVGYKVSKTLETPTTKDLLSLVMEAHNGRSAIYANATLQVQLTMNNTIHDVPIHRLWDIKSGRQLLKAIVGDRWDWWEEKLSERWIMRTEAAPAPAPAPDPEPTAPQPASLPGEGTGKWLCLNALVGKRVDVVVQGLKQFVGHRFFKVPARMEKCEGQTGFVLIETAIDSKALEKTKIPVRSMPGSTAAQHVPPPTVKPCRVLADGTKLEDSNEHVVIIGPDWLDKAQDVGLYGLVKRERNASGCVAVLVDRVGFQVINYFPSLHLCIARNELNILGDKTFARTIFEPHT